VRALVVVDSSSAVGLPLSVDNLVMRARSIQVTLEGGMDAMAEFAIASNPNVSGRIKLDPRAREEVFAMYRMLTPLGYANALRALLQMDYITERLPEIAVPTLLVCGDEDPSLGPMRIMAGTNSPPNTHHRTNVRAATAMTPGTNTAATRSARA